MKGYTVLGMALRSLQRAPIRSSLTALGVIVGVAAVVATVSIGSGAREKIQETLARPESRTIYLGASVPRAQQRRGAKLPPREGLNPGDYYAIRKEVGNVSAVSPRIHISGLRVQANGRAADVVVEGIDVDGFTTLSRRLIEGALFSAADVRNAAGVCVVNESLARLLFAEQRAPGHSLRIKNTTFRIIGLVDDMRDPDAPSVAMEDLHVYIPFTSLLRRLDTSARMDVSAQAYDIEQVNLVERDISDVMEQRRSGRKADFRTNTAFDSIRVYADGSLTMARLLAAVGAISLVVGGIGIMNIMLVSVTERTREIGVRMAIGTRSRDILGQFLAEAIVLSLLGGGIGIVLGWMASVAITHLNEWPTAVGVDSVLTSLICSATVGVFFGYYPARRAALMRPVDALRSDH